MDLLKNLQNLHLSDDKKPSEHAAKPPPTAVAPTTYSAPKHESLFDKIGDVLGEHKATPPPPVVAIPAPVKKEESLFGILGDAIGGGKHTAPPPAPVVAVPEQSTTDKLFSKLGESFTGKQTPPPPPAPKKEENLFDKIGDKLTGRKTPPPPPKEEDLFNKLNNIISGKKEEPRKPQGIAGKINSALGGGSKGEAEEDKLDKAIDFFQEHVLKQGDQSNESALEQAKDKQIANAIRNATKRPKS